MDLAPDFDEFIECLTAHGVEFVVVDSGRLKGLADIDALKPGANDQPS